MGGDTGAQRLSDIWSSSDGKQWSQVTANAAWAGRSNFGCVVFKDKLWVLGGVDQNYQWLNDLWCSSDGSNWQKIGTAGWTPRSRFGLAASDTTLYVVGGQTDTTTLSGQVWSSGDGSTWEQQTLLPASTRSDPIVFTGDAGLFVMGGIAPDGSALGDLNAYSGSSWSVLPGLAWSVSRPGCTLFRGGVWMAGGTTGTNTPSAGPNKKVYALML